MPEFDCQTQIDIVKEQLAALNEARVVQSRTIVIQEDRIARLERIIDKQFPDINSLIDTEDKP